MAAKKSFRNPRADREPVAFDLVYEVRAQEKVNVGSETEPAFEMRDIEPAQWVEESREFHARMNIRAGLIVDTTPPPAGDTEATARFSRAIQELMTDLVVEKDDFRKLLDDPRVALQLGILIEIVNWAIEESGKDR